MSVTTEAVNCQIKTPKRVVHFSDGVIEESDGEEEDNCPQIENQLNGSQTVDQTSWPTVSYVKESVLWFGNQTLKVCDYLGEGLANFFGITSPKYESEIDEYVRRIEDQKNYETKQMTEFYGWTKTNPNNVYVISSTDKDIPKHDIDLEKQRF